jgi:hypothetical protein
MLRARRNQRTEVAPSSMLARIPEDVRKEVISYIGPRSILPLMVTIGRVQFQVVRRGGICVLTRWTLVFGDNQTPIRQHHPAQLVFETDAAIVGWLAHRLITVNNRLYARDPAFTSSVDMYFTGLQPLGMQVHQTEGCCDPRNGDGKSDELFNTLEYNIELLGSISSFDTN